MDGTMTTDPKDCAPEAPKLAVKLGKAAADCAEAGLDLDDLIEIVTGSYETWIALHKGGDADDTTN